MDVSASKIIYRFSSFSSNYNKEIDQDALYNDFNHIKLKYMELKEKFGGIDKQIQSFISSNLGASKQGGASIGD